MPFSTMTYFPEEVVEHIFTFLGSHRDRNVVSLVCKTWYKIERLCRKSVFVGNCYVVRPERVMARFPEVKSLTVKGKPHFADFNMVPHGWGGFAGPWIEVAVRQCPGLEELRLKRMVVSDENLELLAGSFPNFKAIVLDSCEGFSTDGLATIATHCRFLRELDLLENEVEDHGAQWLSCFPDSCTSLVSLNFACLKGEVNALALERLVARSPNLRNLRLNRAVSIETLMKILLRAPQLVDLGTGSFTLDHRLDRLLAAFDKCKSLQILSGFWDASPLCVLALCPSAQNFTTLNLSYAPSIQGAALTKLLRQCHKLRQLWVLDNIGDKGLAVVATSCKDLQELRVFPSDVDNAAVTEEGLVSISSGCTKLNSLLYFCNQMTNAALVTVAKNCPNFIRFRLCILAPRKPDPVTLQPLDEGFGAIVQSCKDLRRLSLSGLLTDRVFLYIGMYAEKLEMLSIAFAGDSDKGMVYVLNGCKNLRKLEIRDSPFGDAAVLSKSRRPQTLIKLVMRRLESSFRSFSRPVLHAAARVVQEMGKSRAAAYSLGVYDMDEGTHLHAYSENIDSVDSDLNDGSQSEASRKALPLSNGSSGKDTIAGLLASLMEVVRTTVACECVYVRGMVIKSLIWMQNPHESFEELGAIIASELSDPAWPSSLLNDILLTLHARFKATPAMAVTLLEIARIFATKVPGMIDADVLQLLWKTCLVGAGTDGKHTALEAVTLVLDLPPPQPGSMSGLTYIDRVSASDPKSALALQRLVQAAVWFLGENANYAASEYAWESATPPGTALMMLDADKMVAAASSRNPTLAGALTRLQRCAFSGSWEVRIVAVQALMTIAIRSGEPYRLQIYEFLHALALGGVQSQFSEIKFSNGEDQGASGTGLGFLISRMLKVLDDIYMAQDDLIRDMRNHDNNKKEWTDEELKKLYETHERLLDLVSLFCFVPRAKYLPLGPTSAKLIDIYRNRHNISAASGLSDPAVATGISDLVYESKETHKEPGTIDPDLAMAWAAGLDDGAWESNAPAMNRVNEFLAGAGTDAPDVDEEHVNTRSSTTYDDMWAKTLLETYEAEEDDAGSSGASSPESTGSIESSISSHFGGMNYPSLFSSRPSAYGASQQPENRSTPAASRFSNTSYGAPTSMYEASASPIREEPPSYSSSVTQRFESFENPLAGRGSQSFSSHDDEAPTSGNPQSGKALYDFTAGGDDELSLDAGEEVEIDYEVDGWYYVKKKRPGRDGKLAGLVPVLYVDAP